MARFLAIQQGDGPVSAEGVLGKLREDKKRIQAALEVLQHELYLLDTEIDLIERALRAGLFRRE